jgi:hypothetical protein
MRNIRKFSSIEEYDEKKEAGLVLPNISFVSSPSIRKVYFNSNPKEPIQYCYMDGDTLVFTNYAKISSGTLVLDKGSYSNNILIL